VELNGVRYNNTYLLHQDIMKGGVLKIQMGNTPNKEFGQATANRPHS